jgi:hypothetical protein
VNARGRGKRKCAGVGVDLSELPAPCPWRRVRNRVPGSTIMHAGVDGIAGSPQGVEGVLGIDLVSIGRRRRCHADCLLRRVPAFRWVVSDDPGW